MSTTVRADQAEARFWAALVRNRNLTDATRSWGAVPVAGGYAIALPGTPLVTAIGAGTTRPLGPDDLTILDEFYGARNLEPALLLPAELAARDAQRLSAAGYASTGESSVLEAELAIVPASTIEHPVIVTTDRTRWLDAFVAAGDEDERRGWGTVIAGAARRLYAIPGEGGFAAVAALGLVGGAAFLFGAATRPAARGRGMHRALIGARLQSARADGASWAFGSAPLGSAAERNALAAGLRRVGTRSAWRAAQRQPEGGA